MGMISELKELVNSAREKDPAATNTFEIIMTYSGVHAILNHRIANWMYRHRVPFFPRWISQCSRFFTGIEIHPGAKIGKGFFIVSPLGGSLQRLAEFYSRNAWSPDGSQFAYVDQKGQVRCPSGFFREISRQNLAPTSLRVQKMR